MRKKLGLRLGLLAIVAALCLLIGAGPAAAKDYTLRIQSVYAEVGHGPQMLVKFAAKVEQYTKGQVKVKLFWPGQLVPLKEGFDAVGKGMMEGLYSCLIYYGGIMPEGKTEWLPFSWRDAQEAFDIYTKAGYLKLLREASAKHKVFYLSPIITADMGFMTSFPVKTLADFKGKKLRATGVDGLVVKTMGAAAVTLPASDLYISMQRGTVDGITYPYYTLNTLKLNEVVKCVVLPGVHTPSITGIYLNSGFWKSLPANLQKLIEKAALETFQQSAQASKTWDQEGLDAAKAKGLMITTLPDADVKKLRQMCQPLWAKVAKSSPLSKKMVDLITKYLKSKGAM
ncbi:MAG: TRAP transporter substrate-binding protein DctP [Thermodesulfobacteriota bacterium]